MPPATRILGQWPCTRRTACVPVSDWFAQLSRLAANHFMAVPAVNDVSTAAIVTN